MNRIAVLALAALAVAVRPSLAQGPSQTDMTVDAATRRQVVDGVLARLIEAYVFPDTAVAMQRAIQSRVRRGEYDRITSAQALADSLTSHLQAVSKDRHLRVRYSYEPIPQRDQREPTPGDEARARAFGRQVNFGFEKVERLAGNVGYLELRSFGFEADWIGDAAAAAFDFLANTDALIIDIRRNGGGSPQMVAFVSSYLFGPDSVHLNSLYWRPANRTDDFYTRRQVPGTRYGPDRPIYVLTSRRTFSGAEEFAYNLQTRKRAVIVGDTTGGGAHPGGMQRVTDHFGVWVPSGRAINPITKTNWERVGVRPDVAVTSDQALRTAHLAALRGLRERTTDPQRQQQLDEAIAEASRPPLAP
ncbi:MAG TPA: S41 family peptidase [Gemmatimonadales bacterium]|nr:S41 family peptidase [Gemmatimonadales bacterium]